MIKNLLNLFFPKVCAACNSLLFDNEKDICTECRHSLPVTNFHFEGNATVKEVFYGRVKIEHATSLLRFHKKGIVQQLLHNLKYRGHQSVSKFLGTWLGAELNQVSDYQTIDAVIPVPLHKSKLKKRGYNQVTRFGQEIAYALDAKYIDNVLLKTTSTSTQVFKKRFARWIGKEEVFSLSHQEYLAGKHVLLVDDIITTGATIESCVQVLQTIPDIKISVATMAIAE